ncbi:hypothetical protein FA95DRAFT_1487308, partial [Auriscalpium vulgare]
PPEISAFRPSKYPFSILWNKEDCSQDDDSGWTDTNPHRPPMRSCFRSIRNSARIVKADLLAVLPAKEKTKSRRSIGYFRSYHPQVYKAAVKKLEEMQPLLALCGNNWKAEQMLRNTLNATKKEDQELEADSLGEEPIEVIEPASDQSKKRKKDLNSTPIPAPASEAAPESEATAVADDPIDVDFIVVDSSGAYAYIFRDEFPDIKSARPLLEAMKAAEVEVEVGEPHDDVVSLLNRLESADPNDPSVNSDNKNESWGHKQFTAGLKCAEIKSWKQVGDVATACRLIAAALRTCKVARHICFVRNRETSGYLSDVYLEKLVNAISACWNEAHPVRQVFINMNT